MSQRRSAVGAPGYTDLAVVGRQVTRAGVVVVAATLPLVAGTFIGMLADAPTLVAGLDAAVAAMDGPLVGGFGTPWLFHVGTLGLLAGCWLLGAGFVLDGLFD